MAIRIERTGRLADGEIEGHLARAKRAFGQLGESKLELPKSAC